MSEIVVNATAQETRVALLEHGTTAEIWIERQEDHGLVGNIYCGRVTKIFPGMQAAFVDIGLKKAGFLYVSDILPGVPEAEQPEETPDIALQGGTRPFIALPPIDTLLHEGQELLVQVTKEPLGNKGCRLAAALTLAGRYLVLMPGVEHIGVSRRITSENERERLRQCVKPLLPAGMGCIIRTLSDSVEADALAADLRFLMALWQHLQHTAQASLAPSLVYQEFDLVLRTIRDLLSDDVERLVIDDPQTYERALAFVRSVYIPALASRIEFYQGSQPIFDLFGIERDIERALQRKVWLKSGGYITIDSTEALVAIDVNTGRFVGSRDPADTILRTNLEAAEEIVHQLRLRNLGGLIIIDFIDMEIDEHKERVFSVLESLLKYDRAHTKILQISEFGLVEMTRKRTRPSLEHVLCVPCPLCRGTGIVESGATMYAKVMREVQRLLSAAPHTTRLLISVSVTAAEMVQQAAQATAIEQELQVSFVIKGDTEIPYGQFEVLPY